MKVILVLLMGFFYQDQGYSFGQLSLGLKTASARYNTVIDSDIKGKCGRFGVDGGRMALLSGGVYLDHCDYEPELQGHGLSRMSSNTLELHFTLQIPVGIVSPYAQLGYIPFSSYRAEGQVEVDGELQEGKFAYRGWGPTTAIGLSIHPIPFVSIFFQSDWSWERLRKTYVKIGGRDLSGYEGFNSTTQQYLAGIDLSLF